VKNLFELIVDSQQRGGRKEKEKGGKGHTHFFQRLKEDMTEIPK